MRKAKELQTNRGKQVNGVTNCSRHCLLANRVPRREASSYSCCLSHRHCQSLVVLIKALFLYCLSHRHCQLLVVLRHYLCCLSHWHCQSLVVLRHYFSSSFAPVVWGIKIQPTFDIVRVVRGDLSWDINCPIPPAHCMLGLLACCEAYEFGQLGTGLS